MLNVSMDAAMGTNGIAGTDSNSADPNGYIVSMAKYIIQNTLNDDYSIPNIVWKYLNSKFAIYCILLNVLVNRILIMVPLRSNIRNATLPLWSHALIHILPITLLLSSLLKLVNFTTMIHTRNDKMPLSKISSFENLSLNTFILIGISHVLEMFYSVTCNLSPLRNTDNTIFELSIMFYSITRQVSLLKNFEIMYYMCIDCIFVIINRISLHVLELSYWRNKRTFWDIVLNFSLTMYTCYVTYYYEKFDWITFIIRLIVFPTNLSILIIFYIFLTMQLSFYTKGIINWKNSGKTDTNDNSIDYHNVISYHYMKDEITKNCSFTGEEELSTFISQLSLLLCGGVSDMDPRFLAQTDNGKNNSEINYKISGYLNEILPTEVNNWRNSGILSNNTNDWYNRFNIPLTTSLKRFSISFKLVKWFLFKIVQDLNNVKSVLFSSKNNNIGNRILQQHKDYNKLVNSKNYAEFIWIDKDSSNDNDSKDDVPENKYLLPDFDSSMDFKSIDFDEILKRDEEIENSMILEQFDQMDRKIELKESIEELNQLFSYDINDLKDLSWYMSMWSILKYQLTTDIQSQVESNTGKKENFMNRILTRSQYAKANPNGIIKDTIITNKLSNIGKKTSNDHVLKEHDQIPLIDLINTNDDDDTDKLTILPCLICKENPRNIIMWPCKCLTVCDNCRSLLGRKGYQDCLSCTKQVNGYTKVNLV